MTPPELDAYIRQKGAVEVTVSYQNGVVSGRVVNIQNIGHIAIGVWQIDVRSTDFRTTPLYVPYDADCVMLGVPGSVGGAAACPRCGDAGEWRMLALYCRKCKCPNTPCRDAGCRHGRFAG